MLRLESLEGRALLAGLPYGAMPQDTAEFMLGKVAVTPVFLESNGQLDASTENWSSQLIQDTLQKVEEGVTWWSDLLAAQQTVHSLQFVFDTTYASSPVATKYEPINRVSNDYALWSQEFLAGVGFNATGNLESDMRAFNNAQRLKMDADWSFTIFVVNSQNDGDGQFPPSSSFPRAFSFAGGLFTVCPSSRPASTFAHETGHIFWAKDEYAGGASYAERRGYYNTPNDNAADNPGSGFVQQPSIMATGELLDIAYASHISPPTTLAMVGWQDSDQDGIFDVLDVPLELQGTGYFDVGSSTYRFHGSAKVGVLPNLNPAGLRNDITLNRISSVQYRVDGGAWITAAQPDSYEKDLDLNLAFPQGAQTIEIRAIDAKTGVTSNVFQGRLARADAVAAPGLNGFVWIDDNGNDLRDAGEYGDSSWTVDVLSSTGQPLDLRRTIEPDNLADGPIAGGSISGINITAVGSDTDGRVGAFADSATSTGTKSFRVYSRAAQSWLSTWSDTSRRLQVELASPTSVVEIDAIGGVGDSYARLEAYDAAGKLIDRFTTTKLSSGQVGKMRVESAAGNIARVVVGGHAKTTVRLDNLRIGPETRVTTQALGHFSVPGLPTGNYLVKVTPASNGFAPVQPGGQAQPASVTAGAITNNVDFAFQTSRSGFQNPLNRFDVNGDQSVSPLDVLLIVNDINQHGPRDLALAGYQAAPFLDVSGDGFSSALDALLVINEINKAHSGEGPSSSSAASPLSTLPSSPAQQSAGAEGTSSAAQGDSNACSAFVQAAPAGSDAAEGELTAAGQSSDLAPNPSARDAALLALAPELEAWSDFDSAFWKSRSRK